jgi:hypothetical protein
VSTIINIYALLVCFLSFDQDRNTVYAVVLVDIIRHVVRVDIIRHVVHVIIRHVVHVDIIRNFSEACMCRVIQLPIPLKT